MTTEKDFTIFTTFRGERTEDENLKLLNRVLVDLNKHKMGPYLIDGHFPETDIETGKRYDASESSLMVVRPDTMNINDFINLIIKYCSDPEYSMGKTKTGKVINIPQESALFGFINEIPDIVNKNGFYFIEPNKNVIFLGTNINFNKTGEYYSKMKGQKTPFIFEGIRTPSGGMLSGMLFNKIGLKY